MVAMAVTGRAGCVLLAFLAAAILSRRADLAPLALEFVEAAKLV